MGAWPRGGMWVVPLAALPVALLGSLAGCGSMTKEHKACKKVVEQQCLFYGFPSFDQTYRPANYEEMCSVTTGVPKLIDICLTECSHLASKEGRLHQATHGRNKEYHEHFHKAEEQKRELSKLSDSNKAKVKSGEMKMPVVAPSADKPVGEKPASVELEPLGYCVTHAAQGAGLWRMNELHCSPVVAWACPGKVDAPACAQLLSDCQRAPCRGTRDEFKACIDALQAPLGSRGPGASADTTQRGSRLATTGSTLELGDAVDEGAAPELELFGLGRSAGGTAGGRMPLEHAQRAAAVYDT